MSDTESFIYFSFLFVAVVVIVKELCLHITSTFPVSFYCQFFKNKDQSNLVGRRLIFNRLSRRTLINVFQFNVLQYTYESIIHRIIFTKSR